MSERLTELLPWYVNDTLSDVDRKWVDSYLAEHPEARGELVWYMTLQRQIRESTPVADDEVGLNRAMAKITAEKSEIARAAQVRDLAAVGERRRDEAMRRQTKQTVGDKLRNWVASWTLRPAMAVALAVIAVQSVVLVNQTREAQNSEIRAVRPGAVDQGPVIKINFKADATEADIRLLLIEIGGTMAGGPGQLGDWYVRVPASKLDEAQAKAKANKIVDATAVLDAVPARD